MIWDEDCYKIQNLVCLKVAVAEPGYLTDIAVEVQVGLVLIHMYHFVKGNKTLIESLSSYLHISNGQFIKMTQVGTSLSVIFLLS